MGKGGDKTSVKGIPLTDRQILGKITAQISARSVRSILHESKRLTEDLILLDDAMLFHGIDKWRWVGSVIEDLTDGSDVENMLEGIPLTSILHRDRFAVARIVDCLMHWEKEGVLSRHDCMIDAVDVLTARLIENMQLSGSIP